MSEKFQIITLTLDNGETYSFAGRSINKTSDSIIVTAIEISEPLDMPDDYKFASLNDIIPNSNTEGN